MQKMYSFPAVPRLRASLLAAITLWCAVKSSAAATETDIQALIAEGSYSEAERLLKERISDPQAPITSEAAIQLEILRRTRSDFPHSEQEILAQLQKSIPDANSADIARWREAGDLHFRQLDGELRYFRQAVPNLFRFNEEARRRRTSASVEKKFNLNAHIELLVEQAESAARPEFYPVTHRVQYELVVKDNHPRVQSGRNCESLAAIPSGLSPAARRKADSQRSAAHYDHGKRLTASRDLL
jgi:hypothetical protein